MRIHISELDPSLTISLTGEEDWLAPLYAAYPLGGSGARLGAELKLALEEAGSVLVRGRVTYTPSLNCARCDKEIPFPLDLKVDARYLPEATTSQEKEINLSEADLDAYYLDNDEVDLLGLLIDTVNLAIPSRLVVTKEDDEDTCGICGLDLSSDQLYGSKPEPEASPFSVLKDLKLH
jgi:uncharacterized metal-binding protein YceD (DUF177 family)